MTEVLSFPCDVRGRGPYVVAIGAFDGVHEGHVSLLEGTVQHARSLGARSAVITFDRDPESVISPQRCSFQLLTLGQTCGYIAGTGIDLICVIPFTSEMAALSAERFLDEVLAASMDVAAIHVGQDFRFGAGAIGDLGLLGEWASRHGAEVRAHELHSVDGAPVTATRIRKLVGSGQVEAAARLLGRPHLVSGMVEHGRGEGRLIGFATANVAPRQIAALPTDGVYACWVVLQDGTARRAAVSVGIPPTFTQARHRLEVHIIDWEGDLYDQAVTVAFIRRLRDQRVFDSPGELGEAIARDVASVRRLDPLTVPVFTSADA